MSAHTLEQLGQQYQYLRRQYQAGQLSQQRFFEQVDDLKTRDEAGSWWAIDAESGAYLYHDGTDWVPMSAPPSPPARAAQRRRPAGLSKLAAFLAVGMPLVTATVWFVWGALHPVNEGIDCLTPLIIAGVPICLLAFQKPLDRFLLPLQPSLTQIPKPLRLGAAIALPVVLGFVLSSIFASGFGAIRLTLLISMLGAQVLLRKPEVYS